MRRVAEAGAGAGAASAERATATSAIASGRRGFSMPGQSNLPLPAAVADIGQFLRRVRRENAARLAAASTSPNPPPSPPPNEQPGAAAGATDAGITGTTGATG